MSLQRGERTERRREEQLSGDWLCRGEPGGRGMPRLSTTAVTTARSVSTARSAGVMRSNSVGDAIEAEVVLTAEAADVFGVISPGALGELWTV